MKEIEQAKVTEVTGEVSELMKELEMVWQPRSDFTLNHFVVAQHDTLPRQRLQALMEIRALWDAIQELADEISASELDIEEMENTTPSDKLHQRRLKIEINRATRKIDNARLEIIGRMREMMTLVNIVKSMPKFTPEEIEADEQRYWMARLTRQSYLAMRGDVGGNMYAILQALTEAGNELPRVPIAVKEITKFLGMEVEDDGKSLPDGGKNGN